MRSSFRIVVLYALFATFWILATDRIVETVATSVAVMRLYSSVKGIVFVTVTSLLLLVLVRNEMGAKNRIIEQLGREAELREQLIAELHHRIKNNLQVVIGLINIEAQDRGTAEELAERVNDKLVSLSAVFNVVYDMKDMKNLSFLAVMREYARLQERPFFAVEVDENVTYDIETVTSCLLLVDAVKSNLHARDGTAAIEVNAPEPGVILIRVTGGAIGDPGAILRQDEFIRTMLKSLGASMTFDGPAVGIAFPVSTGRTRAANPPGGESSAPVRRQGA